jgi:hypothetical protein
VDVIFVLANNGTMSEEIEAVKANINASFATFLGRTASTTASSCSRRTAPRRQLHGVHQPPLGGSSSCGGNCPVNTRPLLPLQRRRQRPRLAPPDRATYDAPDPAGGAGAGRSGCGRRCPKVFIEITDNGRPGRHRPAELVHTADYFESRLLASPRPLSAPPPAGPTSSTASWACGERSGARPLAAAPTRCRPALHGNGGYVQQPGTPSYQKLSKRTRGPALPHLPVPRASTRLPAGGRRHPRGQPDVLPFQLHAVPPTAARTTR